MTILRKNWTVAPCPEHGGLHPLHDNRLIVAPDADGEGGVSIVARMSDLSGQAQLAHLITAAPDLLSAFEAIDALYNAGALDYGTAEDKPAVREAFAEARAAVWKARGNGCEDLRNFAGRQNHLS